MSRTISESIWRKSFLKPDGRYDGHKFETLALELLGKLYGEGWRSTAVTRDGSRDYEKRDQDKWLWAECKAYSDRLSIYVISPTLVMAVIERPDAVIVISRSHLNANAVRHLAAFESAAGKKIVALDGSVLDDAILGTGLSDRYFPELNKQVRALSGVLIQQSITPDAFRDPAQMHMVAGSRIARQPVAVVRYGLIRIDLILRNLSALQARMLRLEIVRTTLDPSLRLVSFGQAKTDHEISISIPPAGIVRKSLIVEARTARELLELPTILAKVKGAPDRYIKTGSAQVSHLYQIELVGKDHRRILKLCRSFLRGRRQPVVICTEGTSGSGKTRLLSEIAKHGLSEGFRCHFYNPEFEDVKAAENVLRDLIADLNELPRLVNEESDAEIPSQESENSSLIRALYDPTFALWDNLADVVAGVVSLLIRKPTLLVIDNLQFTDNRFIDFINALIVQLRHAGNRKIALVLSINTDFVPPGSRVSELLMRLRAESKDYERGRTICHTQLKDFGLDDVAEFISKALSGPRSSATAALLYEKTLQLLVRNVEPKPLNLWQSLMYLADEGVLSVEDDRFTVSGKQLLGSHVENIPVGLDDLLELRWRRIRENESRHGLSANEMERTVRALYFLGSDTSEHLLAFGATRKAIDRLVRLGILLNQSGGLIQFFHGQVFAFFRRRFLTLRKGIAKGLTSRFRSLELSNAKFQQYFIVSHFAGEVSPASLKNTVQKLKQTGLTRDYWRQYARLLFLYLNEPQRKLSATSLTGVTLLGIWQQRLESLQSGQTLLIDFLIQRVLPVSRKSTPGPALFDFYTATINACLAVYEDERAVEVITVALNDLRLSRFPDRKSRNASLASVLNRKAATLKNFGRIEEALEAGFEALRRFEAIRDYSMVVETLFDLGSVSVGLPEPNNANELFERGCELFKAHQAEMREPAGCRHFYVSARLAIKRHDFDTAHEHCSRGARHAERLGISFWGIRLVLLEAIARLLTAHSRRDFKIVNELMIKARDWANISHAERSRVALSYIDGKLFVKLGEPRRAADAFAEAVVNLALRLRTPEQLAWKSPLLVDIVATCRRYNLKLDPEVLALLNSSALRAELDEIRNMSEQLFKAFERRRATGATFYFRNNVIELP